MLFGIPPHLPAELLHVIARMGHGDTIVLVDSNYPAHTTVRHTAHDQVIELSGRTLTEASTDLLTLMPLDSFHETPAITMADPADRDEPPSVHVELTQLLQQIPGAPWPLTPIDRFEFYEEANQAFAIVRTLERRPYGNVIFRKGVIGPNGELMTQALASAVK